MLLLAGWGLIILLDNTHYSSWTNRRGVFLVGDKCLRLGTLIRVLGLLMTKRADLHEQREQAVERFGLTPDAFLVKQYRPSVTMAELSDEHMSEAIEMASLGAFESAIARVLGVPENVFMSALRKGKIGEEKRFVEFSKAFYEARKKHLKRNLRVMNEAVEEGDWKPAAWQLERSFGFAKQEVVEHDVAPEAFSLMQLAQIPVADARAIIEAEAVEVNE
jgi:hypothetical protein